MSAHGLGIIGAGVISTRHAQAAKELNARLRLVGIADVSTERCDKMATNYFAPYTFGDYRELLDRRDIRIVAICTPPNLHEQMVKDALDAGKYVVCEKPLSSTLAGADRMIQICEQYPGRMSTVYQLRFEAEFKKLQWIVEQDMLGDLRYGNFRRIGMNASTLGKSASWWGHWTVSGGGIVMTQFIHHIDQVCVLFGRPTRVSAHLGTVAAPIDSEDTFGATIEFENGAMVTCGGTIAGHHSEHTVDVVGERASVHMPWRICSSRRGVKAELDREIAKAFPVPAPAQKRSRFAALWRKQPAPPSRRPKTLHAQYYESVLDAVDADEPLPIGPAEARVSQEVVAAIYASALEGSPVDVRLGSDATGYDGIEARDYLEACTCKSQ